MPVDRTFTLLNISDRHIPAGFSWRQYQEGYGTAEERDAFGQGGVFVSRPCWPEDDREYFEAQGLEWLLDVFLFAEQREADWLYFNPNGAVFSELETFGDANDD